MTWNPSRCGIYCIINTVTYQCYLGSSYDIFSRVREHFRLLRLACHQNSHLQASANKYGYSAFGWFILERCSREEKHIREQHWIDEWGVLEHGFNIRPRADSKTVSEETKRKISASLMGHTVSASTLLALKMGSRHKGTPHTPEWNAKIAAALRDRKRPPLSDEWKRKLALNAPTRAVDCFDLNGNYIATFRRIKDAMHLTNGRRNCISLCLNGKSKTAYGYIWKDATDTKS